MIKKIIVKAYFTNELYEFVCFSEENPEYFIYRTKPMENRFDMGLIDLFEPVNLTWEEVRNAIA